jgi:RNA polymerase sigma factor (TIGR02999 family)
VDLELQEESQARSVISTEDLFASLYQDLRRIARRELRRHGAPLTLGPTTLLHEAYLDLQPRDRIRFAEPAAFFSYASRAMRGLIIDFVRNRQALKRGAGFEITSLPTEVESPEADATHLQRLSDAIDRLAQCNPRLAQVVDLKYFSGFSFIEIAAMWNVSARTVQRDWEKARIFLHRTLTHLPPA